MTVDTLISGGRIVTESNVREADIAIDGGEIVAEPGHGEFLERERPNRCV